MKARILVIEDEMSINDLLCMNLEIAGYETVGYLDGNEAYEAIIQDHAFQCALVDIMLPGRDGYSLLPKLKQYEIPVIFLTAKGDIASKIKGLKDGAEDYIVKPFLPQELILRIYAVLRRSYKEDNPLVVLDGCTVDFDRAEVYKGNEIFFLTAKEHMLLKTLARNEGKIITVDALCEALWGDNPFGYENSLNAHVRRVREKIETDPSNPKSLITIKGLGYKLIMRK